MQDISQDAAAGLKVADLTFDEFLEMRDLWNETVQGSLDNDIFLTWEWLSTWWRHYQDRNRFLVIVITDGGRIVAAAPLMTSTYSLWGVTVTKLGFLGGSDYQNFVLTEAKPELAKMLIEYADHKVPEWDFIGLNDIPCRSVTARTIGRVSTPTVRFDQTEGEICPYVALPKHRDAYLAALRPHFASNLAKREGQLRANYKLEYKLLEDPDGVQRGMSAFFDLHQKRRAVKGESGMFSDQRTRDFHLDVAKSLARRRWLVLALLLLDDEPVAATYNFRYGRRFYFYQSGLDPHYSQYSVGSLLHMHMISHCIASGMEEYDFMKGDEPYKAEWSTLRRTNVRFEATKRKVLPVLIKWISKSHTLSRALRHRARTSFSATSTTELNLVPSSSFMTSKSRLRASRICLTSPRYDAAPIAM